MLQIDWEELQKNVDALRSSLEEKHWTTWNELNDLFIMMLQGLAQDHMAEVPLALSHLIGIWATIETTD